MKYNVMSDYRRGEPTLLGVIEVSKDDRVTVVDKGDLPDWYLTDAKNQPFDRLTSHYPYGHLKAEGDDDKEAPASVGKMDQHSTIVKIDADKQQVFGWAYVTHSPSGDLVIDKSGEFVDDPGELEKAAYNFVMSSRKGGAFHMRDEEGPIVKSHLVESMVFTREKQAQLGIPEGILPIGWWVGFEVKDREIWKMVKDGKLTCFSIHGSGSKKAVE